VIDPCSCSVRVDAFDPFNLVINFAMAKSLYMGRRYDESIQQGRKMLEMEPRFPLAHWQLGVAYAEKGIRIGFPPKPPLHESLPCTGPA
jgi:hypothetical protein